MVYYTGKLIEKGIQTMRFGKAKKQNNLRIHPLSLCFKNRLFFLHCIAESTISNYQIQSWKAV